MPIKSALPVVCLRNANNFWECWLWIYCCIITSDLTGLQVRADNTSRSGQVTCPVQGVQVQVVAGQLMSRLQVWLSSLWSSKVAKQSIFPFCQLSSSREWTMLDTTCRLSENCLSLSADCNRNLSFENYKLDIYFVSLFLVMRSSLKINDLYILI